jgi:hypothetical protein
VALASVLVGPAVALAAAWALTPALGALGGALLAHTLGARPWGAALAGALVAWAPWVRVTLANGQVEQAWIGGLAAVWAAAVWAERGRWFRVLLAPAVLLAVGIAGPNLALTAAIGLPLVAAARVLGARPRWTRHAAVVALALVASLGVNAYHSPGFGPGADVFSPRRRAPTRVAQAREARGAIAGWQAVDSAQLEDATPTALLVPTGPRAFSFPAQHSPFLGYGVLLAALLGATRRPRTALPWVGVTAGLGVLSLGARWPLDPQHFLPLPWLLVEKLAPAAAQSGSPSRLAMGAVVALAAAAGVGLRQDRAAPRRAALLAIALAGLAWAETTMLPGKALPHPPQTVGGHGALDGIPDGPGAVLDLPLPVDGGCEVLGPHYLAGVARHARPYLHNADGGHDLQSFVVHQEAAQALHRQLKRPRCARHLQARIAELGVGVLVGHQDPGCALDEATRACIEQAYGPPTFRDEAVEVWVLD